MFEELNSLTSVTISFPKKQKKMANRIFQRLTIISLLTKAGRQALLRMRTQESADQSLPVQEIRSELPE